MSASVSVIGSSGTAADASVGSSGPVTEAQSESCGRHCRAGTGSYLHVHGGQLLIKATSLLVNDLYRVKVARGSG
jgi:hypothetical protein